MSSSPSSRTGGVARYVMVGGFLGAGKTTAVDRFATVLTARGLRVGLITNDQSTGLVDTAVLRSRGHAVEEIPGGCFCCRFDSLQQAADRLTAETAPDVFLAEPVGSCTDLIATVSYPLRRMYGDRFRIAPLSVLVDPLRASRILGLRDGRSFSKKVVYVYEKQLEEAEIIVVNKCDTIGDQLRDQLAGALRARFPRAEVLCASAKDGDAVEPWLDRVMSADAVLGATMPLDYDVYAAGEALLGWLNATFEVRAAVSFDGNALIVRLAEDVRARIAAAGGEVAHLKATLDSRNAAGQLSVVSIVGGEDEPDLRESLLDATSGGALILNVRAELAPETLHEIVGAAVDAENRRANGLCLAFEHEEHFRPARPTPTHRVMVGVDGTAGEESS